MTIMRTIRKVWRSRPTIEGAGVHLKRAFGNQEVPLLDPFLLLDDFRSDDPSKYLPGFPWHPHRGIETITYVLQGSVEHGDSMGNKGDITSGDVQWMTAGSGIVHQEMPKGDAKGRMGGFQLWANLPASQKMMDPRYRDVKRGQIPEVALEDGVKVKIISGRVNGVQGPVQDIVTDPEYLRQACVGMPGPAFWAVMCRRRMKEFGTTEEQLARIAVKNHNNACHNPYAQEHLALTLEDVLRSEYIAWPLKRHDICVMSDGAAVAILASESATPRLPLW